jgi:hypothetical protein
MACARSEIVLDAGRLAPTLATVDALARLQLAAGRAGCALRLRRPSAELCELVRLAGLADALDVEAGGQPEEREERVGVEEEPELDDPPA